MAPSPVEHLVRDLSRVASASAVRRAARRCGAVQRQGVVDIHALLMTVVLGVSVRGRVSLAELRRVYGEVSGTVLARSSFYDRFNEGLAGLLKWLLDALMASSRDSPPRPPGALAFFEDVLCEDATILRLPDEMADAWPGPRMVIVHPHATPARLRHSPTPAAASACPAARLPPEARRSASR